MTLPSGTIKAPPKAPEKVIEKIPEKIEVEPIPECNQLHYLPSVSLEELEKQYILKAFEYHGNNKTLVAAYLGITIKTLFNKLYKYGVFENYRLHSSKSAEINE
jgi:DNA-binding NtrC family response regulator